MTTCTEQIRIPCSPERAGAYLEDIRNLPEWTGFFRSVGAPVGDRFEVETALGTTIRTRIERGDAGRFAISSLVRGREERAEVAVDPVADGVDVALTVNVLPALAKDAAGDPEAAAADGIAAQRARMRDELSRLRAALADGAPPPAPDRPT